MSAPDRARAALVDRLLTSGRIRSPSVEDAFRTVPRHLFLPDATLDAAYADDAVAVQHVDGIPTSSASQPSMMAIMLEQLDLRPGHRVLEIGAGTGYNAALMSRIVGPAGAITAVDIDPLLVDAAARHLTAVGAHGVELHCADGALGYAPRAPYDRIVLTVGAADVWPEWVAQLAPAGRLLLPLTLRGSQLSVALDLDPDGQLHSASVRSCAFIRLRGIGAGGDRVIPLPGTGLTLQVPEDAEPAALDPQSAVAALAAPGRVQAAAVQIGPADLWDGFGLWLALTEPGTCRLLADDENAVLGALYPVGPVGATIALVAADGMAAVTPSTGARGWPRRPDVRSFGHGAPTARLLAALSAWDDAARPTASDLRLRVLPRQLPNPPAAVGAVTVWKEFCAVVVDTAMPSV